MDLKSKESRRTFERGSWSLVRERICAVKHQRLLWGSFEDMDEKDTLEKTSQVSGSSPTLVSATLKYGKPETMPHNKVAVDMDEKFIPSASRGGDVPSSPTSRSEISDEEEDAPLLEDDALEKVQTHTEFPVQSNPKTSFIKPEHKIALTHFLVSEIPSVSKLQSITNSKQRIFSYSTRNDRLLLRAAAAASICTGVTLPL